MVRSKICGVFSVILLGRLTHAQAGMTCVWSPITDIAKPGWWYTCNLTAGRYSQEDPIMHMGVKSSLQDTPFLWICPLKPGFGSYGSSILIFIKDLPYCFPYGCPNFSLHPCSHFPPLSLDDNHPNRCQVMAHCDFDLGFPDGQWC